MKDREIIKIVEDMAYRGMDHNYILQHLEKNKHQFTPESIDLVKNEIDDYIINYQLASQKKSKALNQIIFGFTIFFIGSGITLYTYFNYSSQYILAYGAILTGAWILKEGYKIYQKPIQELIPKKQIFRR